MFKPYYPIQINPFLSFESLDISHYIIDELLNRGAKRLYSKYLGEKIPDHNGQYMIDVNRGVLQLELIAKDEGENQFTYINKWNEEDEPLASKIDSWGTLTIRREVKPQQNVSLYGAGKTEEDVKSSKSFSTTKSYTMRSVKSRVTNRQANKGLNDLGDSKVNEPIFEIPKVQKTADDKPVLKDEDYYKDERLRAEREVKAKERNEEMAKKAKKQQEDDEVKEKIKLVGNKLKNKDYTYDYDGSFVYVRQTFRPENLPAEIPVLDHNYKAPPEVLKQPYEHLGIKIKEKEETIARASFTKEEILKQLQKSKPSQQKLAASQKKKLLVSSKKKPQQSADDEEERDEGIELPRQIPLVEIMEAKTGVNIVFDNGILKEGKQYLREGRMKKEDFEKVLEERKKMLEDQRKITRLDSKSQSENDKNNEFKKQVEKIKELKSTTERNLEIMNNLGLKNRKLVLIHEEQEFVKMMATNLLGPQVDIKGLEQRITTKTALEKSKVTIDQKAKDPVKKVERINMYKKVGDLLEGQVPKRPSTAVKSTKLHQIIEEFNENEIINNPKWGSAVYVSETQLKEKLESAKKPEGEKPKGIKLRERGKLTAGNFNFFPRIGSPATIKNPLTKTTKK